MSAICGVYLSHLQVEDGLVVYRQNMSSVTTSLVLQTAVNDGLWHTIRMSSEQGMIQVYIHMVCVN